MASYENHDFGGAIHRILRGSVSVVLIYQPSTRLAPLRLSLSAHRGLGALSIEARRHYDADSTAGTTEVSFVRTTVGSRRAFLEVLRG